MNSFESVKLLLAASGGHTVKLFDMSLDAHNQCVLTYSPSPGHTVNSVKWNHNNMVLASAGDDGKVSLWKKNGQSLWTVPAKTDWGGTIEPPESISTINFCNKGSRYLCSGGTGHVVRIWDLQNKRCVKWLKGHTDAITGVMCNCKNEHIASVSRKGDLIVHNLASGAKAAELKDPNGQVLGALDYSRMSRHLLVTAGDDGSINLWDITSRSPKVSWLKQHSAPTSGVSFAPSNDKIIASVGLDKKLYIFDTGSRKPASCIPYEAPFSSLAFCDDRLTVAAGTTTGEVILYDLRGKPQPLTILRAYYEAISNLCWQRSKPVTFNEYNCTDEMILVAGDRGDSILIPDPLPSRLSSSFLMPKVVSGSQNPSHAASLGRLVSSSLVSSGSTSTTVSISPSEKSPPRSSLLTNLTLARLHAPHVKDDMDVFSPLVEVQPLTPSTLDKLWDDHDGSKKDQDRKHSFLLPSQIEKGASSDHPIFDWKSNSAPKQDDGHSTVSQMTSDYASTRTNMPSSVAPPKAFHGRFLDKFIHRKSVKMPSRFAMSTSSSSSSSALQDGMPTSQSAASSLTSDLSLPNLGGIKTSHQATSSGSSEAVLSPLSTKKYTVSPTLFSPRRFPSYTDRIGSTLSMSGASSLSVGSPKSPKTGLETREELLNSLLGAAPSMNEVGSPKSKKTGLETGEELLNSLLSNSQSATGTGGVPTSNGGVTRLLDAYLQPDSQQGTVTIELEETLASFQESVHEDMRNLHLEILRQFHMHEMEMSSVMRLILENQAEIMKEIQSLRKETQHLRQLL